MIQGAGAKRRRIDGLPGDRVGSGPGELVPGRGDLPGRQRCHRRPAASHGQDGGDQGTGQPGQQHRGAGVQADVGDPDLHGRVARGRPGQEVDAPLVQRRPVPMRRRTAASWAAAHAGPPLGAEPGGGPQVGDDKLQDIVLESPAGQRRSIDVGIGFTVFEVKAWSASDAGPAAARASRRRASCRLAQP
jgi:hypothetical protein